MRALVDATGQAAREQGYPIEGESELGRWIEWAREYIESIDPVTSDYRGLLAPSDQCQLHP
jgi:hypothetical protein